MSRFVETLIARARDSPAGLTTGEPLAPVRRSWAEVHEHALRVAADLGAHVAPKEAVALLADDVADIVPAAQGAWLAGASVTVLQEPGPRTAPTAWTSTTLRALDTIEVALVLLGEKYRPFGAVLAENGVRHLMLAEIGSVHGGPDRPGFTVVAAAEDDIALLQLTSGSTALPKAVRISHGNLYANLMDLIAAGDVRPGRDVTVSWAPMYHDMGMVGCLLVAMAAGIDMVGVTPTEFLRYPDLWPTLLSRYRGTITAAPNFAYALMTRQLDRAAEGSLDLSAMRIAINGGEPIDPATMRAWTAAGARFGLPAQAVNCSYGASEGVVVFTMSRPDEVMRVDTVDAAQLEKCGRAVPVAASDETEVRRFPLLGYPLDSIEIRVLDENGAVLGDREVGAIQVRGASLAAAYSTADGLLSIQDSDGWCDIGDQGYLVDGQVVVCGRRKDMIIIGGRNIYPTDIERAVGQLDGVRTGNVIAVRVGAEGIGGIEREQLAVLVESRQHDDAAAVAELRDAVTAKVLTEIGIRPAEVCVLAPHSLPKTPSGKLRRSAARALL